MDTANLTGPDLSYWVARTNMHGHEQNDNVVRRHYGEVSRIDPSAEPSMREFVTRKFGQTLPERSKWH